MFEKIEEKKKEIKLTDQTEACLGSDNFLVTSRLITIEYPGF